MTDSVWGRRKTLHTAPDIQWSMCDGCPSMDATPPDPRLARNGYGDWDYYCVKSGSHLTRKEVCEMNEEHCPEHRTVRRRFK